MRQYETFELCFHGQPPRNVVDTPFSVEFTQDGHRTVVKGFYDGNGTYKVRYYPRSTGACIWQTKSAIPLDGPMEGETACQPARAHGMVQTSGLHFRYEDGVRYCPFGTTVYALAHQSPALIQQTMGTLQTAPFNKVRLCVFPKFYDYNQEEPGHFPFAQAEGWVDVTRPDPVFWQELEEVIAQLGWMGIEADLILFHPYDKWGFAKLSKADCLTYLDYAMRRLAAFPNAWWSLANEYDLMEHFPEQWWYEFAAFLHEIDPYGHLLSNHNSLPYWDFTDPNITHCSIQDSRMKEIPVLQEKYRKPVIFDECCYEGNIHHPWGNLSGFELAHRFWTAYTVGGYCSHGETFLDVNDILWWSKGGVLHGESPKRIAFLRSVLEELPGDLDSVENYWNRLDLPRLRAELASPEKVERMSAFEKALAKMPENRLPEFIDRFRSVRGHCGQEAYLSYYGRRCAAEDHLELPKEAVYDVEVIDIWEMTRVKALEGVSGRVKVSLPGKEGIAVLAVRVR